VFGSREKAMRWLETEVPSLDNRTPLSLITSAEGMAEVEDVLGAIEHGAW
jgi:putative toxin-antitoxin system antitoxin component (TIGR02293 family)